MEPRKVLIVDDHTVFRQGLVGLLKEVGQLIVVGDAADGLEAIQKVRSLRPDVVLMDVRMPKCDGVEATKMIKKEFPPVNVIMLTMSEQDRDLLAAIRAGARGYLLKTASLDQIVHSIELLCAGEAAVSPTMAMKLMARFGATLEAASGQGAKSEELLTVREREILGMLTSGASNRDIGVALFISENTVRTHLRSILKKLHVGNRAQAAVYAVREGLVETTL